MAATDVSPKAELEARRQLKKATESGNAKAELEARRRLNSLSPGQSSGDTKDLPELSGVNVGTPGQSARLAAGFVTTPDVESRKDIIKKVLPGTDFDEDENGNTIINLPDGQRAFLNKPGFSPQDFIDFSADVIKFIPAGRFAAGGRTLLRRMFRGGLAALGTSVAEDIGAKFQGSEQGFQAGKAGVTTAADIGAEAMSPVLGRVARVFKRTFGKRTGEIFDAAGGLTGKARKALQKAGIDPDQISPDLAESAIRLSDEGVSPSASGGVAITQRFGVPLTRGQATGDFSQLATEESLRGRGDAPGNIIREFDRRQNERLLEVRREVEEELGEGTPLAADGRTPEEAAGARIGSKLRSQADDLQLAIDDAFENARGANASLTRDGLDRLSEIPDVLRTQDDVLIDAEDTPATFKAILDLEQLSGDEVTSATLREVDRIRRRIGERVGTAKNRTDRRGVTLVKRRLDQYIDDAFDNALFTGDEEALDLLKNARKLRAEYGQKFQEQTKRTKSGRKIPDPGGRAMESIVEHNATDEGVVNMIFGRSRVFNSENAVKTIRALRNATDNADEINNTLKQLTFRKISDQAVNNGRFSPRKFVSAFDRMMETNPAVMKEIFSKEDMGALKDLRNVSERLIQPEKTMNPSGTANALIRAFSRVGQVIGLQQGGIGFGSIGGQTARQIGEAFERSGSKTIALDAINPKLTLPGRPNATVISATIAAGRQGGPGAAEAGFEAGVKATQSVIDAVQDDSGD